MNAGQQPPRKNKRDIFLGALDHPTPAARAAYLDGACGKDLVLRAAVEALLQNIEQDSFLESSALDTGQVTATSGPGGTIIIGAATEKPGDKIGRYKLLQQIGEGGCGVVYMADQEEPVKRRVALKVIKPGMDTKEVLGRFEAERQALALMDHSNIAKVLDAGATATGRPFFVMELVRGIPITRYCDENKLNTEQRLELFIQVCQAIQHAHQKGIIHRDIKPSNILVADHDGVPVPKIIDFGIAKATSGQTLTDKTVFTALEQFIGTPAYMSPEQAKMSGLDIDTRSDIYSLGVLLYELLTGKTPFDAKKLFEAGFDEIRRIIREEEPPRPSQKLSTLAAEEQTTTAKARQTDSPRLLHLVRGDLDWIVMKCLEKDRNRRYETANGLASDLERHINNEAVLARPPSNVYRFQKLVRRNKLVFAAGTAVGAAVLIGLAVSTYLFIQEKRAHDRALAAEQKQSQLRKEAEAAQQNEAQLRRQAEAQELASRQRAYASDINLAQQALAMNNLGRAQELLTRYLPTNSSRSNLGTNSAQPDADLRGWEWRYLWKQCQSDDLFTLCRLNGSILSLSTSSDGNWLAVFNAGGLSVWGLRSPRELEYFPNSGGPAAFSPREPLLALVKFVNIRVNGGTTNVIFNINLWDAATKQTVAELPLSGKCTGLNFSADGQTLVVSTQTPEEQTTTLWRVSNRQKVASFPGAELGFAVDGQTLLTSTAAPDAQIILWRISDRKKLASFSGPEALCNGGGVVARDLSVAAYVMPANKIHVLDLTTGKERWSAIAADEHVPALAFSPDGKTLASSAGYIESAIRLWDVTSGKETGRLEGHRAWVSKLVFWPDGKTLASASADKTIRLWDIASLRPVLTLRGHEHEIWCMELLQDNKTLVSGAKDGSVRVWDTTKIRSARKPVILPAPVAHWRFASDSKSVLTLDNEGRVARWQGTDFQQMESLMDLGTNFLGACITADGRLLAVDSSKRTIQIWDLPTHAMISEFAASKEGAIPVSFMAQAKHLLLETLPDYSLHEWDLKTSQEKRTWGDGAGNISVSSDERWCLKLNWGSGSLRDETTGYETNFSLDKGATSAAVGTFSPDGKFFATGSEFGFAKVWETSSLHEVATIRDFLLAVHSVAFSPDGQRLALGSAGDQAIRVWDMRSHQDLINLAGQGSVFHAAAFSPDGNVLGSLNWHGLLHLWRAPSWPEIEKDEQELDSKGAGIPRESLASIWSRRLAERAEHSDADAQNSLGWIYANGQGVAKDAVKAAMWYHKAAEAGNAEAQDNLGWMYANGNGGAKDAVEAAQWFRKAAVQGNANAQDKLGWMYADGEGMDKDAVEAVKWFRKAADQGNDDAQDKLASMYADGDGVAKDAVAALKLRENLLASRREALGLEDTDTLWAMQSLADSYDEAGRRDEAIKLREDGLALFRKVNGPENPDTLQAMHNLANSYYDAGHREEALKLREEVLPLRRKVLGLEHADTLWAMRNLAYSYDQTGHRDEALKLREELLVLFRKVNGPENPDTLWAMRDLSVSYDETSRPGEAAKLREELLRLRLKAADRGDVDAQNRLGWMYANGEGAAKDPVEAVKWYRKAAEQGNADGQSNLAYCYEYGLGVQKDLTETLKWYRKSAEQGNLDAMSAVAWELATSENSSIRDGASAVKFAEKVVAATNRKKPNFLDTLAAAYAETGQFDKAVAAEKLALALLQNDKMKKDFGSRLSLYQSNTPYREP